MYWVLCAENLAESLLCSILKEGPLRSSFGLQQGAHFSYTKNRGVSSSVYASADKPFTRDIPFSKHIQEVLFQKQKCNYQKKKKSHLVVHFMIDFEHHGLCLLNKCESALIHDILTYFTQNRPLMVT